ncbi:hypothetical protein [Acidovorax sp. SUPP3334]|uniref:hypothetical protein n=1 Tax=Acidovorax sp. SUPP3334 TaxID=2920881 RepID=UPI0023DE2A29|nr:hypothetical protein [Acidovorax sp. SUPP3334]GKT23594.1 hypothetical protein AVHM3334_12140 [Acidovorax sp. SUPP3334]
MAITAVFGGYVLNSLDNHYGIKGKVIAALKMLPEQTAQGIYYIDTKTQSWQDDLRNAVAQKKVELGRAIDQSVKDWLCRIACVRY